ncbi:hypothetical protein EW026_g2081 [Hermanssonia centrifuga]|uniref:DUF6699 domain-containing protein n=1 Tax=Hermanssonia centrifuga TaxID=98765 RepID=A0A4S4KQA1_9APHY|nr:hypothetical protein EW026_g2081 [Hermanssonia centrifuga]
MHPNPPVTPSPNGRRASAQTPSTPPSAPYLAPRGLPLTPYTPAHPLPAAPYMGPIPLPNQMPQFGLPTPPESPVRQRQLAISPLLSTECSLRVNMQYPQSLGASPYAARFYEDATTPPTTQLEVTVFFTAVRFTVYNPRGLSVQDVLQQIMQQLSQPAGNSMNRRIDLMGSNIFFGGLSPCGNTWALELKSQ